MHTQSSDSVLTSLSTVVGDLITLIAQSNSTGRFPELEKTSLGVVGQVDALRQVAGQIVDLYGASDEVVKSEMAKGVETATESAQLLLKASQGLTIDPTSLQHKTMLMTSLRGLLDGSKQILASFERSEIRLILTTSSLVHSSLTKILSHHYTPLQPLQFRDAFTEFSQRLSKLGHLAHRHSTQLIDTEHGIELNTRAESLTHLSPSILSACKLFMSDGTQGTYFEVVETVLGMVSRQCVRIEEIVKFGMDENVDDEVQPCTTVTTEPLDAPQTQSVTRVHVVSDMLRLTHTLQNPTPLTNIPDTISSFLSHLKFAQSRAKDSGLTRLSHQIDLSASLLSDQSQMIVKFNSNLQLIPQKDSGKRGVLESIVRDAMRVVVTETGKIGGECLNGLGVFSVRELVLGKKLFWDSIGPDFKASIQRHDIPETQRIGSTLCKIADEIVVELDKVSAQSEVQKDLHAFKNDMTEASLSTLSTTLDNAIANALSPKIEKPLVAETVNDSQDTVLASLSLEEVAKLPEIVPLSEEEALANPMKAAAVTLQIAAQPDPDSDPLAQSIRLVSQHLINLSNDHSALDACVATTTTTDTATTFHDLTLTKTRFLSTAASILHESKKVLELARHWMTATTNPILCKELSATVCKIETVATQLRIIVAVKAADPGDKDKGMQVVKCCANLVDGLIACLGHSRAIQKASKGGRCK